MDPNHVFNSPSFDAASGLSRPPRLAKLRKPLTGHRPNLMRPNNNNVIFPGLSSVEPGRENVGRGFGFASNSSSGGGSKLFAETVMSSSDVEKSKVVDKLSGLQIGIEETFAQSKNSGNVSSSSSSIGGAHLSAKDHGLPGVDQSVVSELPDEMRRLYIESQHFTKKNGGNMEGELPTKMKKLNIKDYERETFAFGRNDNESVGGSLDTMFPNKMKGLKIKESLDTSVIQKLDNEVSSKDNTNKFMFGKSGNANSPGDFNTATAVGNNSNHTKSSVSSQFGTDTMHNMQTGNPGDGNFPSGSGPFNSGYTFQAGLQSKNMGTHTSDGSGSTSTSSPLFASSITRIKPIGDVPQTPFVDRAEKTVEFSFTSKLGSVAAQNVEFTTPDPKGHSVFGLNRKGETKRESAKDTGLKKKKGKWKKPAYFPPKFGQDFGSQDNSQKNHESTEQYSPMDVSPYEEILVDNRFSRETSVASDESFQLDENNSSTEVHSDIPNDIAEECLISATERLYINKSDVKCSNVPDQESLFHVNETIELENPEEGAVSGAETESFKSATDEIDYSTDSFITAADFEVSSGSSVERQDSDGGTQFKYDTSLPHPGEAGFIFASSSASPSVSSASIRDQKKKNRSKGIQDSYSSTQSFKVSHPSSGFPPIQVSGSSSLSPKKDQKSDFSSLLSNRRDKSEKVKELQTKQDSTQAASVAAQESCEKWRLRGNQAYAKGDFLKAEDCYTHGVNCISQNEASRSCLRALMLCYSNRAATRMSLGRVREALEDCVKAAALDPSFLRVQVRAASCYLALGDVENATLHFMKILQEGPDVCADRKLLVDASEGLEKAQKVAECEKQAAELLRRRTPSDVDFAISLIAEALMISSYSEKLLQMKADALLVLKKYEDLIQFCEQLLSVESNFPKSGVGHSVELHGSDLNRAPSLRIWCCSLVLKSYFYLGKLEEGLVFVKKQEESVSLMERSGSKTLESMIPLVGTIRELLHHKTAGNEAYQSGNHAEAVEHYTASISCSVESPPFAAICFCNRAAAYRAMGQIVDALADCSLAIALDGNYFKAISRRAALYEMIRDYGQAVTDLQKLVSLLTKEVDKKKNQSGSSDKVNCVNELRQARQKLLEMEEAARKEIPLNMYLILGIEPSAAASEIRKAYRKAALKYHPDKAGQSLVRNENSDDGIWKEIVEEVHKDADRLFKMIGEAYAVLSDPTKRSRYDLEEEMRTARGNGSSMTKMYTDFQNYSSERSGSRRQWQEVRRTYETSRGRSERNWYY